MSAAAKTQTHIVKVKPVKKETTKAKVALVAKGPGCRPTDET